MQENNLKSSALETGECSNHIVCFENSEEKTFFSVNNNSIFVDIFTSFRNLTNKVYSLDHRKVNWYEIHGFKKENSNEEGKKVCTYKFHFLNGDTKTFKNVIEELN